MDLTKIYINNSYIILVKLYNTIQDQAGLEVKKEIIIILRYLISIIIKVSPTIAPVKLIKLAKVY